MVRMDGGNPVTGGIATSYAGSMWAIYDLTEKVQAALRADFLSDRTGNRTSDFLFSTNTGQDLWSVTLS